MPEMTHVRAMLATAANNVIRLADWTRTSAGLTPARRPQPQPAATADSNCPFCGDPDPQLEEVDLGVYAVVCQTCLCTGPVSDVSAADALELWLTRDGGGA